MLRRDSEPGHNARMASRPQPVYHDLCHTEDMASKMVRARLDDESASALRFLVGMGMNESEAVRTALLEARESRSTDEALWAECARLMADPEVVAHNARMIAELEDDEVPWPE